MTLTVETDLRVVITADAEAIEHAIHVGLLARDLGLCTDAEVVIAIAEVVAWAAAHSLTVAALMAGDCADDPDTFCRRMLAARWRSCQIHHAEDQWPALSGRPAEPNGGLK